MKLALIAVLVAFVCYISMQEGGVNAQDPTTVAPTPPKNKTCKGKKRVGRSIGGRGSGSISVSSGGASASASVGGGVNGGSGGSNPAMALASAASKAGKDAAALAIAGSRKVQAAVKDGVNTAKKVMSKGGSASVSGSVSAQG